ncbi:alpha-N-arabinofuranosidase [Rhodohalobacter sp. 614A]|uniref:alpha-N-arabinofuranosidase n=1 Tax=Rhodohalobacter sp. 614A TaxID=2908649 RepID=UPI001F2A57FF|nr:alpha-L-arabinofuranosidase C-terminal domain-containing protein [Rhodohalobacter sp. 614A]
MKKNICLSLLLSLLVFFPVGAQDNKIVINADQELSTISRHIYGHFAEHLGEGIYGGVWVGEDSDIPNRNGYRTDVLEALEHLEVPNIRWPGGCYADEYNWRDGIGPMDDRPNTINTHWGMVIEDNSFGTHEFLNFTEMLGAEPVVAMNVGSGTPREMQNWIEYMNYGGDSDLANLRRENGREEPWGVKYVGIGNESWGCGGNMDPEYYSDLYKRFATYVRDYSGTDVTRVASGFSNEQYDWTDKVMEEASHMMDAISLHYYTIAGESWGHKGTSVDFGEELYFDGLRKALRLDEFIEGHTNRMDKYDPEKRVALFVDEWGIWTDPLPGSTPGFLQQQNSLRDALIAAISLDIMNKHSDRVKMANIAQMVNVLQAVILTDGDQMVKTPTYHVFDLYRVHFDTKLLQTNSNISSYGYNGEEIPSISLTASKNDDGLINLTITNLDPNNSQEVELDFRGIDELGSVSSGKILTADEVSSINTYEDPENVVLQDFSDHELNGNKLSITLPSKSVVMLTMD